MVSPGGWYYWTEAVNTVSISRALELHEYRAPLDAASLPFWIAAVTLVVMTWARRDTLRDWSRADRALLVAALLLAAASVGASRNVAFFAVIAAPVLSRLCTWQEATQRRLRPVGRLAY